MRRAIPLAFAVIALAGCGAGSRTEQVATPASSDSLTLAGILSRVGADPVTQLVVQKEGEEPVGLVGPLVPELQELLGLEIRVTGMRAGPAPPAPSSLEVRSYELIALNGVPAYTGTVERSGNELHLVKDGRRWILLSPPDELHAAVGAKAWVVGEVTGDTLRVASYGIIRRGS
jgi:hypothetical protein